MATESKWKSDQKCPMCGTQLWCELHVSSDEAYEDIKMYCPSTVCGYYRWIEGPDA